MHAEIIATLSRFLDAVPDQVATWDMDVVNYLAANQQAFHEFKVGSELAKWSIYTSARHRYLH